MEKVIRYEFNPRDFKNWGELIQKMIDSYKKETGINNDLWCPDFVMNRMKDNAELYYIEFEL